MLLNYGVGEACWESLGTTRSSNQSILKEISPEYSLEVLMLKLKFQYFGHLIWRADSLKKTLMLGKIEVGREGGNRGWDGWMASLTQWTLVWANSGRWWSTGKPGVLQSMGSQRVWHDLVTEQQLSISRAHNHYMILSSLLIEASQPRTIPFTWILEPSILWAAPELITYLVYLRLLEFIFRDKEMNQD